MKTAYEWIIDSNRRQNLYLTNKELLSYILLEIKEFILFVKNMPWLLDPTVKFRGFAIDVIYGSISVRREDGWSIPLPIEPIPYEIVRDKKKFYEYASKKYHLKSGWMTFEDGV